MKTRTQQIEELQKEWTQPRWEGITRPYSAEDVVKLRGSVNPECTLAQLGAAGCVLLGDPAYYRRFGFECHAGLVLPGVPPEYFMALAFKGAVPCGAVSYHPAFAATA